MCYCHNKGITWLISGYYVEEMFSYHQFLSKDLCLVMRNILMMIDETSLLSDFARFTLRSYLYNLLHEKTKNNESIKKKKLLKCND